VRAETSTPRSASSATTFAADRRKEQYQWIARAMMSRGQRKPVKGVAVRSVKVRRQA
jgi:hypothetical protein